MLNTIADWLNRYFSDKEALFITSILVVSVAVFSFLGHIMVPIMAALILAYMLNGCVAKLRLLRIPNLLAVTITYVLFVGIFVLLFFWLIPLLLQQLSKLVVEIPQILTKGQKVLIDLQVRHPEVFSSAQLKQVFSEFSNYAAKMGKVLLSFSLASIANAITAVVYLVLVPLLVFFFMKDRNTILHWLQRFLPSRRESIVKIFQQLNQKIGSYIRGKALEVFIISAVSIAVFMLMRLDYAVLLGVLVGVGVIIPYVGAVLVTVPILIIGWTQWGFSAHYFYLLIIYATINLLDANLLAPLLFSEALDLHPVAIILSVLIFGSIWGFWGVFFAIPLASLVGILFEDWPIAKE